MTYFSLFRRAALFALLLATFTTLTLAAARAQEAKPFLHPLFVDNMVLQRGMADAVWGWTAPGQTVTIRLNGKTAKAVAGADGKWTAKIGPFAAGGPYTLTVSGPQTVTVNNVLVGDVWLCSGQSNMQFGIGNSINGKEEIAAANYPNIRLFYIPDVTSTEPRDLMGGNWQVCSPQTIAVDGNWSGFSLSRISSGGNCIRTFMSPSA